MPGVLTAFIVLTLISKLLPWRIKSPQWTRNIIKESIEPEGEPVEKARNQFTPFTIKLLALSVIGFLLQLATLLPPKLQFEMISPAVSWAVATIIIAIYRPTRTPKALFVIYISIFVSQFFILVDTLSQPSLDDLPLLFGIIATSIAAICEILNMPLRDPLLPVEEISPPFGPPNSQLRSPEDNLTLWQFMTVSWMSPIMSLASSRQLNDEDVWSLAYEFQHKLLSDKFRELKGTVIRRLVDANGVDLIIITVLSFTELFASKYTPHTHRPSTNFCRSISTGLLAEDPPIDGKSSCTEACSNSICRSVSYSSPNCSPVFCIRSVVREKML